MQVSLFFGALFFIIVVMTFGTMLSSNIENINEFIIFWLLYITTVVTFSVLLSSFYLNLKLKNLKGPRGPQGEQGDQGSQGETGKCETGCRNDICSMIIEKAISRKLEQLEDVKINNIKLSENDIKTLDYIYYYDSMNYTIDEIYEQLLKKKKENKIKTNKYIDKSEIRKQVTEKSSGIEITNIYIKEKIKSMCHSDQFKEISSFRGPLRLIEYLKDIWMIWTELIYNAAGINYFKTVGAENDFEWMNDNPYNEIKKYDVFYWGMPRNARPYIYKAENKHTKNVEINEEQQVKTEKDEENEPFKDYTKLEKPKISGTDKPSEKAKLKVITTNDYFFTYDNKGTYIYDDIRTFRPYSKYYKGETYYPLGDISIGPTNKLRDYGDEFHFGDFGSPLSKSPGKSQGPNVDTILVAGDIKKPIKYQKIWTDQQDRQERHKSRNAKDFARHKGIVFKPICPEGYAALGHIFSSRRKVPPDLAENIDLKSEGKPKGDNQPVCVPESCIVKLDSSPEVIMDTQDSKRSSPIHTYEDKWGYKIVYSYNKINGKDDSYRPATHENAYNLLFMRKKKKKHIFDKKKGKHRTVYRGKKKYMFRIKDECIANRGNVNLNGDDFKHPSILKEDKTGLINEDKGSLFKHIANNDVNTENKDINKNLNEEEILSYLVLLKNKITLLIEKKNLSSLSIKEVKDLSNLISKVKSFPDYPKDKYKKLHKQNNVLSSLFLEMLEKDKRAEIIPIRNKFGLGWINQPYNNLDPFNEKINHLLIDNSDYSQFHFFYINNNGVLNPKTNTNYKLDFKKVLYPDYYTLQNSEDKKYCKIEDNKIIFTNPPDLQKDISENINYMFKLKLNGSESDNIFIQPYDNKNGNENKYLVFDNYNISKLQLINDPLNNKENSKTFVIN